MSSDTFGMYRRTLVFLNCCLTCVYGVFFLRQVMFFPMAASSGRLALRGHVSTTDASVDSGGGEGRGRGTWPFLSDLCQHSCVSLM